MKTLILIVLGTILISCSDGLSRLPEPNKLISKEQMVVVMKDMIKLESHIQLRYKNVAEYHKTMINSGDSLLQAHNVTRKMFDESIDYYGSRQEEMQDIYGEILDDLTKELAELQSQK